MANGTAPNIATTPIGAQRKSPAKGSGKRPVSKKRPSVSPTPIRGTALPRQNLVNMFEVLRNSGQPMQTSGQGVPYKVLVGDPNEDPGYLRPPTQQDIDYGGRLDRAQRLKASGRMPGGRDPVAVEQRITAAERQTPIWRDEGDSLRESIYGKGSVKGTLSNVGDMLTGAYEGTLGKMVPFAYLPGGAIHAAGWGAQPNQAEGWPEKRILAGEGTPSDQSKSWQRGLDLHKHKYYGEPDPGPRPSNVYDELGMPQPKPATPMMDYGQGDVPLYLTDTGKGIEDRLGPYKIPPPGAETGLPAGALQSHGLTTRPYFTNEQKAMLQDYPTEKLSPQLQDYVKRLSSEPESPPMIDLSGGGPSSKEEEDEGEKRFNILEMLLGLLGLPLKLLGLMPQDEKKKSDRRRPIQPQRIPWQAQNRMNMQGYQQQRVMNK